MNVGQILETHMGWAARGLGLNIDEALQEYKRSGDLTPVREAMHLAYGDDVYEEGIAGMDEETSLMQRGNVHAVFQSRRPSLTARKKQT